jgi:NADH-quinone oxidoreductase subunit B
MGACASSGGVFDTYAVVQGIDRFLPVDIFVPGCPPRPEQLIQSIIDLQDRIRQTGTLTGKEFTQRTRSEAPACLAPKLKPAEALVAPGDYATATKERSER